MLDDGHFYPIKSMKAEERLWWYSRFFDCVEVNSTFYAPLSAENAVRWVEADAARLSVQRQGLRAPDRASPRRRSAARAARARCCRRRRGPTRAARSRTTAVPAEAREWAFETFREALRPLADAGKLGYVLFQMAPWVTLRPRGARLSRDAARAAARRHRRGRVSRRLVAARPHRRGAALPRRARPDLRRRSTRRGRPPTCRATVALTSPVAVLRLHGRNAAGFMKQLRGQSPSVAEKYGYLYDEAELEEIVGPRPRASTGTRAASTSSSTTTSATRPPSTASRSASCSARRPPTAPRSRRSGAAPAPPAPDRP